MYNSLGALGRQTLNPLTLPHKRMGKGNRKVIEGELSYPPRPLSRNGKGGTDGRNATFRTKASCRVRSLETAQLLIEG